MLFKSNTLALVGTEESLTLSPSKITIWDNSASKIIIELALRTPILGIKLRKDMMAISTINMIYAYTLLDYKLLEIINTCNNKGGVIALNSRKDYKVLACPYNVAGVVRVHLYERRVINVTKAHKRAIAFMALNYSGDLIATASISGSKIKIFYTVTGQQLQELRRGIKHAFINQITFHISSMFLACASDKDSIHIFELFEANEKLRTFCINDYTKEIPIDEQGYVNHQIILDPTVKNKEATFSKIGSLVSNYFNARRSFTKLKLSSEKKTCAFADGNNFIVIDMGKNIYLYEIPRMGGYCVLKSTDNIKFNS